MRKIQLFISRIVVIAVIVAILTPIVLGIWAHFTGANKNPPTIGNAPWIVQTFSRYYYGKEFSMIGATPELKGYWTFNGTTYSYNSGIKTFPVALYGNVQIIARK